MGSDRVVAHVLRRRLLAIAGIVAVLCLGTGTALAESIDLDEAEQQRDEAEARREQLQEELDVLLSRIEELKVLREKQTSRVDQLRDEVETERTHAQEARQRVADHYRKAYQAGAGGDPLVLLFGGDSVDDVTERSRVLGLLAAESQLEREAAEGASLRSDALAEQLELATRDLAEHEDELASREAEAARKVEEAEADVEDLDEQIADEKERRAEAARRRAAERERRESQDAGDSGSTGDDSGSSGDDSGSSGDPATVSGGAACPVGTPRSYSDTYGAPRSGGRSHMGVDILSPNGTPIFAYEDGVISRMSTNSLGGITLYLKGSSGTLYYYAHLSGYVSGVSTGNSVSAGQHIAFNGATGNAPVPHLHFEVMPDGSSNVNPTPYADRAGC